MSTIRASASTIIERGVDDVFEYLSELSTMDDWVAGVSGTRLVAGSGGSVGDVYEYEYTYGGRTVPMRVEITGVEAPTRLTMTAREGPFPFEGEVTLSGDAARTRVTNTIEAGADGRFTAVTFALFGPVVRWLMRRRLAAELDVLKERLESADVSTRSGATADTGPSAGV
jgi:uncharacterized protein YndB with AHSA1/START domain